MIEWLTTHNMLLVNIATILMTITVIILNRQVFELRQAFYYHVLAHRGEMPEND